VRFYAIQISGVGLSGSLPNVAGLANATGASIAGSQFCSVVNGANDPGALDVDVDVEYNGSLIGGNITIRGIPQYWISQSVYLTGCRVQMWGGFTEGLPLANDQVPHQGLIVDGQIYPAFGNWTGNDLSLSLVVKPGDSSGPGGPTVPKNIIHNMPKGTLLSDAITNAMKTAFPNSQFLVNISKQLVLNEPDQGFYQGMEQYGNYIKSLSHSIMGSTESTGYKGAQILPVGFGKYIVTDFTQTGGVIPIQFEDLVGQPCWIDAFTIQVKVVMRADINAAMASGANVDISLPSPLLVGANVSGGAANAVLSMVQSNSNYEHGNVLLFTGTWRVIYIRHVGHFRQPTGESWVTIINATQNQGSEGQGIVSTGGQQTFSSTGEGSGTGSST
jgi:hypothetical protein